jgi:pyruvate dehydrogenase E2 component (dihydrolipoamide acetyltransferase)
MPIEIRLAQFGMGMQEATISRWLKREGERVEAGEIILEAESEKTTVEIEAPVSGVLARILAKPDEVIPVGNVLGEITVDGDAPILAADSALSSSHAMPSAKVEPINAATAQSEPRARRLAKESGINLAAVAGSGPNGRITEIDVRRAIERRATSGESARALTGTRAVIARRMLDSLHSMAQLTLHSEADVTQLLERRNGFPPDRRASLTALLIRASIIALKKHPHVNATLENGEMRLHKSIDIGIATHVEKGLLVPVLQDVAGLSLRDIGECLGTLVAQARRGILKPADIAGGSFTITNLGKFGIDAFTPIIQPPQVAILGAGRTRGRYGRGPGGPVWREYMGLSLTFDHRALDGVPAAGFLQTIVQQLEESDPLFL